MIQQSWFSCSNHDPKLQQFPQFRCFHHAGKFDKFWSAYGILTKRTVSAISNEKYQEPWKLRPETKSLSLSSTAIKLWRITKFLGQLMKVWDWPMLVQCRKSCSPSELTSHNSACGAELDIPRSCSASKQCASEVLQQFYDNSKN